jgi:kynureninase
MYLWPMHQIEHANNQAAQYAVQSQLLHHNIPPSEGLIEIHPPSSTSPYLPTSHILSVISANATTTALLLLPGIQYYSGQYLDIPRITAAAHSHGIIVGWDLAHAAGNMPLQLHDWNADFAAWCTYKYMNCGAGAMGALFLHERHGKVEAVSRQSNGSTKEGIASDNDVELRYRPRLSGWWGGEKSSRFRMESRFVPRPGAAGFQISNPSALDLSAVLASLSVFQRTDMESLREKSVALTAYLEKLLGHWPPSGEQSASAEMPYEIITPVNPEERGAQLSLKLRAGLLQPVMEALEKAGVVVDERRPDVVRVAPAPLYNTWQDAWRFVQVFQDACRVALEQLQHGKTGGREKVQ